jgi:hypothetical protein
MLVLGDGVDGISTIKQLPPEVGKSTPIVPPCNSTICRVMYSPSPSPLR